MKNNVLVGSRALAYWDSTFANRLKSDADWDIWSDRSDINIDKSEVTNFSHLNNQAIADAYVSDDFIEVSGYKLYIMSMKGLAIIKRSHLHRDRFFDKHITHFHKHLSHCLSDMSDLDSQLLSDRIKLTKEAYPQGTPSLNKTKEDFFNDAVTKIYDHDWLHELFAYYDKPIYTRLQNPEKDSVWCSKSKWESLLYEDKLKCVAEETYVISAERFLIPSDWKEPSKLAYMKSLKKVCTTLCSGYFRDFALDNYPQVLDLYDPSRFIDVKDVINSKK